MATEVKKGEAEGKPAEDAKKGGEAAPVSEDALSKAISTLAALASSDLVKGKKMEQEDEDEDEDAAKSFYKGQADIEKAIEVSDFLGGMVAALDDSISEMKKSISESGKAQTALNVELVKAVASIGDALKAIGEKVETLGKSVPTGGPKAALAKGGQERFEEGGERKLTKSQVASKLTDMMMKGEGGVTMVDVVKFESTGDLRPELAKAMLPAQA